MDDGYINHDVIANLINDRKSSLFELSTHMDSRNLAAAIRGWKNYVNTVDQWEILDLPATSKYDMEWSIAKAKTLFQNLLNIIPTYNALARSTGNVLPESELTRHVASFLDANFTFGKPRRRSKRRSLRRRSFRRRSLRRRSRRKRTSRRRKSHRRKSLRRKSHRRRSRRKRSSRRRKSRRKKKLSSRRSR